MEKVAARDIDFKPSRFGTHVAPGVQQALSGLPIRSYRPGDYPYLDQWMGSLATFYDGHTPENKLLDQLVDTELGDPRGYFTKSKMLIVSYDEATNTPTGALCLNNKRGGAVKIGPVVVDTELRGRGIGKTLFTAADVVAEAVGARKLFATTSHLNTPVNRLFERYGYTVEATFPDQYKQGSEELIWGKFTEGHPDQSAVNGNGRASVVAPPNGSVSAITPYTDADRGYVATVNSVYGNWHDDLGEDFIDGMVAGHVRGAESDLSFQEKGKVIFIGRAANGEPTGMLTFTPKRGGPVKLYPVAGTPDTEVALLGHVGGFARDRGNHKLYTFAHVADGAQQDVLATQGFVERGTLQSPYKDGHDLVAFDKSLQ